MASTEGAQYLQKVDQNPKVHCLPSGMRFKIITKPPSANDVKSPTLTDSCSVHYHGTFINGKLFDSSMERGKPATFAPNQVIKGWTDALQFMVEGEEWEVYLPPNLAYGSDGFMDIIQPDTTLIFKIRLLKVLQGGKNGSVAHQNLEKEIGKSYADL
ncbi:unnamed protein product [Phytomonas sp. Hart1]|nr:unnamed protein product [Phytomonas sp. Hart1]|eukprot:CCW71373.1 unnamed protein product [Phytomonas sp. isolate Hart1]